jgi:predicted ATPase/class 3 adenylate cyclase
MTSQLMGLGQHGAEVLASLMRELFDPMINSVHQYGGFVSSISGDAFTALFPDNDHQKHSHHLALYCARDLQEIVAKNSLQHTPVGDFEITVSIGLSFGETSWGVITSPEGNEGAYYFRGPVIEGCIESELQADTGEIILSQEIAELFDGEIETKLKGSHYLLTGAKKPIPPVNEIPKLAVDLDLAKKFFPESILTQEKSGEFRHIVNVFISLPTVRTEPQLEIFMQSLFKLQERYGGFLNRLDFGDKGSHLLLFWGVPVTYENDIGRALNFVLALQSETSIPIKVGITYRIAHAGFIGNQLIEEYTCYGEGVNLASRFMAEASRGEIRIDEPIAKRMGDYFDIEYEGEYNYKGFDTPQKTFVLFEKRENIETFFKGPFLDREQEIARMDKIASPLWRGEEPQHLIIAGEPGIGKSRLTYEFRNLLTNQGKVHLWARCQTDQMLRNSFNPIRYWTRNYFNIKSSQSDPRNKRNFNRKLDALIASIDQPELAAELDRTRSFLGSLVNLFWEDSLFEQVDPQSRYENTIIGLTSLIMAESLCQPVILFIEDVQWLDEPSKDFLHQLNRMLKTTGDPRYPVQIIGTSRDTCTEGCLGKDIHYQQILLESLSGDQVLALANYQLGGALDHTLAESILEFADGNPFFTEQILHYLEENGQIKKTEEGWTLVEDSQLALPEDVRAVLVSRLDHTPPEINQLILTASVLGREFEVDLLSQMIGLQEHELWKRLARAEQNSIWTNVDENKFVFLNNLMCDAAYQIQTLAQRQSVHQLAMNALEDIYADDLSSRYGELAYHAEKGNLIPSAVRYLIGAGKIAGREFHNQQAINFFTRAIVLFEETKDPEFFDLLLERVQIYNVIGNRQEQINDLRLADRVANTLGNPALKARSKIQMAIYYDLVGDYSNSARLASEAIQLAKQSDQHKIASEARYILSICARQKGDYKSAREEASSGIEICAWIEDPAGICLGLNILSLNAIETGDFPQAAELLQHSLSTAKEAELHEVQARTLNNLGNVYGEMGDLSSAFQAYLEALDIARMIGNRRGEGLVKTNLGWISGLLGDYATSSSYLEEGLKISLGLEDIYNQVFALVNSGLFNCSQHRFEKAIDVLQQALLISGMAGLKPWEAISMTYLGHAFYGQEDLDKALDFYTQSLYLRREIKQTNLTMEPLAGIAEIELRKGNTETAREYLEEILSFLEDGGSLDGIDQPFRVYTACCRMMLELGYPNTGQFIHNSYQILQTQATRITNPESRQSFLSRVPCHQEMTRLYHFAEAQNLLP